MGDRRIVVQALVSIVLVLGLVLPASLVGAAVTIHQPNDQSVRHVLVDSWSDASGMMLNTLQGSVTPMVAAGGGYTVGLRSDGTVVAVGHNNDGQCNVGTWTDIVQIAAGEFHTVGLRSDGTVVAVGHNEDGQCDVGTWTDVVQVVAAGVYHTVGLKSDGTVVAVGRNSNGQCSVGGWTDIVQVAAGFAHTVGLKSDGTVVAVGWNGYGQCNVGGWTGIAQVAAAEEHTVGLKSDGTVVAAGDNDEGQCNVGEWADIAQVAAGGRHTVGLRSDGTVVAVGRCLAGQCNVWNWTDIVQVATGIVHTVGLKSDGTVVAAGHNYYGQCNVGTWADIVQVVAGWYHTVGLKSDGTVVAAGDNHYGQCNVGTWADIVQVSGGEWHTVGLKSDGSVVAVGRNSNGQCNVGTWTDIVQVSGAEYHTVGLKSDRTVVAAGDNHYGQCNVGTWADIVQVVAGWYHTVGLKSDGTVVAAGDNDAGQCNVGEWADIAQVAAGGWHTVGLKSDGTVVAVGRNAEGQCNVGEWADIVQVVAGWCYTVGLKFDGTVVAVGDNDDGQCNVGTWTDIVQVAAGVHHTVGLKSDGSVVAAGLEVELAKWNLGETAQPPTEIWDWYDLDAIRNDLSGSYVLMIDLDSTIAGYEELAGPAANDGKGWEPVGVGSQHEWNPFAGVFDGQGHEITDMYINRPTEEYLGLFGIVCTEGLILDIGMVNTDVKGQDYVGGLVGFLCSDSVSNSFVSGNVTGSSYVGGLVGYVYSGSVSNSYVRGIVTGNHAVGGLIGENCYGSVSSSHAGAFVTGQSSIGGLIGENYAAVSRCHVDAAVTGQESVGGLIGENYGAVSFSSSAAVVTGSSSVGGLIGENYGTVSNCSADAIVDGEERAGGLIGENYSTVDGSGAEGVVTGSYFVGGLIGVSYRSISNSYAIGIVIGDEYVGGLVGRHARDSISSCRAEVAVDGIRYVGGLIGDSYAPVEDCYATGTVTGDYFVGGLIGDTYGDVSNSFASGGVSGEEYVGGLIGCRSYGTVSDSFWDVETSAMTWSDGGTGKTTDEMMAITTYSDTATEGLDEPWDIEAVAPGMTDPFHTWNIVDGQTYPFLSAGHDLGHTPLARAVDISGQRRVMHPNEPYTVTAKYFDPDGREDLKYCYLQLLHPDKPLTMMWVQTIDEFWVYAGELGESYLSVAGTSTEIEEGGLQGYQLAWTFTINDQWPEVENAIDFGVYARDDSDLKSGWDHDDMKASFLLEPGLVDVVHVGSVFAETGVFYNPLLLPDSVYLYYSVGYTADSEYFKLGASMDSSSELQFSLASSDAGVEINRCRVYRSFTEQSNRVAILQFEVPFSPALTTYTLNMAGFSVPVSVVPQRKDIRVEDALTSYVGLGGGLSAPKFKFTLLGNRVTAQSGPSIGLELGISGGYEAEVTYSGDGPSNDYILFGFPYGVSSELEPEATIGVGAKGAFDMLVLDANLVDAGIPVKGHGSRIQYPVKANIEEDKYAIAAFIVPIFANTVTGSTALSLDLASMLQLDVYSPHKEITRAGITISPRVEILGGDISLGLVDTAADPPVLAKISRLDGSMFEVGGVYRAVWEKGQEMGQSIDTFSVSRDVHVSLLNFENLDFSLFEEKWLTSAKHGQIANDTYIVESGYLADTMLLKEGESYVNRWQMNQAHFSRLYDDGEISLHNLPKLYETGTIEGIEFYQPAPVRFYMDVFELNVGAGVEGKITLSVESEHKKYIPVATSYASDGHVYCISDTSASSIRDKSANIESYAGDSMSVIFDSLKANIDAITEWVGRAFLGLEVNIQSLLNDALDRLEVFTVETGRKVVEISTRVAGKAEDFVVSIWTGLFNPPAAINNANLDFASHIVIIDQKAKELIPEGTAVTIYPKDGVAPESLSDVSVYRFANGWWRIIPSRLNNDGSFTFILRSTGIYALIHSFPSDSDFLTETLVNMMPNSSHALTSNPVRSSDGLIAANASFNITVTKAAVVNSDGTTMTFGESPVVFPSTAETDGDGRLSIPIYSGDLEGEAYLQIRADSGYCAQVARIIVSRGQGIDDSFTLAIRMARPSEGMAAVNQEVELQAITSYATSDVSWRIIDSFGNRQLFSGDSISFSLTRSGIYGVYCYARDNNGFTHTAYAELPVTDPNNDTDGDGVSDNLEQYYGSDPDGPDRDELLEAMEGNRPPVADAGGPYEGTEGLSVTLSALASFDPDWDPLTYTWTWGDSIAYGIDPTACFPLGTTIVTLVVNDGLVDSEPATATVTITASVIPPSAGSAYSIWTVLLAGLTAGASLMVLRRRRRGQASA